MQWLWPVCTEEHYSVNHQRGESNKDGDTNKTSKEIGLNIKGIREAIKKIGKCSEFLQE